ncbi:MAG: acyl carrier protein [Ruminococcus sp.]|nr:acyl carrier protein [Ruminococcus sp.]
MNTKDMLKEIFSEVLNIENVSENDNIFDMGGDSPSIYRISELIKEKNNIEIKPIDIMMYPTIEKLSEFISSGGNGSSENSGEVVVKRRARRHNNG